MKTKIWKQLYGLPKQAKPKQTYASKKTCEKIAEENGYTIDWDYYGKGKHKVSPDEYGEGIAYGTNDVMERIKASASYNLK